MVRLEEGVGGKAPTYKRDLGGKVPIYNGNVFFVKYFPSQTGSSYDGNPHGKIRICIDCPYPKSKFPTCPSRL